MNLNGTIEVLVSLPVGVGAEVSRKGLPGVKVALIHLLVRLLIALRVVGVVPSVHSYYRYKDLSLAAIIITIIQNYMTIVTDSEIFNRGI